MEKRIKVESYKVEYLCDNCKTGHMVYSHTLFSGQPNQQRLHYCDFCNNEETFPKTYPSIEYIEIHE